MLVVISLAYGWCYPFKCLPQDEWTAVLPKLISVFPQWKDELSQASEKDEPPDGWQPKQERRYFFCNGDSVIDMATDGPMLSELGIEYTVKRFKAAYLSNSEASPPSGPAHKAEYAVNIQVAIPDLALLSIQTVKVLEDCCTNDLQRHIDNGFRILAICPPHAQRRPDYIIGHTQAKFEFR